MTSTEEAKGGGLVLQDPALHLSVKPRAKCPASKSRSTHEDKVEAHLEGRIPHHCLKGNHGGECSAHAMARENNSFARVLS